MPFAERQFIKMIIDNMRSADDIPVAVTFISNGLYYVYDVYNNHILKLNKYQYAEINKLFKIGIKAYKEIKSDTLEYKDVLSLILRGYLRPAWIKQIKHPDTDLVEDILSRGLQQLVLQVTQNCNFKCRYCVFSCDNDINRIHNKVNMSWEIAQKSIDFFSEHSQDSMTIYINFYGGEPLLNFHIIKKSVDYIEKIFKTKKVIYNMTTNGSIITDEIIDYLSSKSFNLTISLDGPPDIQNYNRKFGQNGYKTFDIVWKNIEHIRQRNPSWFCNNIHFNPVYFLDENPNEIINFFHSNFICRDKIHLNFANLSGIDYYSTSQNTYLAKATAVMPFQENIYDEFKENITAKTVISSVWHHSGPCVPGERKVFVDINGKLFPCEKVDSSEGNSIGTIFDGIDITKATSLLNIGTMTENRCKNCFAMRFCNICMQKCFNPESGTIDADSKIVHCKNKQNMILNFLKKLVVGIPAMKSQEENNGSRG